MRYYSKSLPVRGPAPDGKVFRLHARQSPPVGLDRSVDLGRSTRPDGPPRSDGLGSAGRL